MNRRGVVVGCVAALALPVGLANSGLRFNATDSVPVGLYYVTSDQSAPYVEFCLSEPIERAVRYAGLDAGHGSCAGGILPLLKTAIVATDRVPVDVTAAGISVAGRLISDTKPKETSRTGIALEHYPFGHYTSGLWVVGSNVNSFDSRYFGPIDPKSIMFRVKPLLTR